MTSNGICKSIATLAESRCVCAAAPTEAARRGLLSFVQHRHAECWRYGDGRNATFRRLDGSPFLIGNDRPKAEAETKGKHWHWPIGLDDMVKHHRRDVIVSEGAPDGLSGLHFADAEGRLETIGIVVMLGSAAIIPAEALDMFKGRRARIIEHDDDAGRDAAHRWADQLAPSADEVQILSLRRLTRDDGDPVRDLNDATRIGPDDFEQHRDLWNVTNLDSRGPLVRVVLPQPTLPFNTSRTLTERRRGRDAEEADEAKMGEAEKKEKLCESMNAGKEEHIDLDALLADAIPTARGQQRWRMWTLAMRIHAREEKHGAPLHELRRNAGREWHRRATPNINPEQTEEDSLVTLADRISRVTTTGNPFAAALATLDAEPAVIHPQLTESPLLERLARLCRIMSMDLNAFGLSSRQANEAIGKSKDHTEPGACYLRSLVEIGILELVQRFPAGARKSNRYRYRLQ